MPDGFGILILPGLVAPTTRRMAPRWMGGRGSRMKAALLVAPERIEIAEIEAPVAAPTEVVIAPSRVGICGSDVSLFLGLRKTVLPLIPGHELVGRIVEVGSAVTGLVAGQRVVVEPNYPCGACRFCLSGRGRICPNKVSMGVTAAGAMAEQVAAPARFVWPVPDAICDEDAATIEPLAVALHAVLESGAGAGDAIAVVGCGAIGLLIAHVAAQQGLRVLAHDRSAEKRAMAAALGAECPDASHLNRVWAEAEIHTVFECAGAAAAVEGAIAAAPRGSQVILMGLGDKRVEIEPFRLVREGIRIGSSLIYDHPDDFARTIEMVALGALRPGMIVTHTLPFAGIEKALHLASTGEAGKVHITL